MKKIITITNERHTQMTTALTACRIVFPWRRESRRRFTMARTKMIRGVVTMIAKKAMTSI
jgi:hypothetical protein